ncbi:hypothetical protein [Azohydromonas caseinilytica]|uniref:Phospholipase/lecithinase/hemolysin n=1 Tax=Azohydromonas caseinilytica TaxID=2728836 RepID=A0A848F4K6_9BURK|nr:hypothetical protein [Azohydromonas caseinilytica]NML13655.1 hypothetical protein [Azohydromonas caseinilytica]
MSLNRLFPRRVRRAALALCAAAVLGACGGGDRAEPFEPQRIVAFGDELSLLDSSGRRYGVNELDAAGNPVCGTYPLWTQQLASHFGMSFAECPGTGAGKAVSRAAYGAKVADVQAQVSRFLSGDAPVEKDLVTILVGTYDVLEVYQGWKAGAVDEAAAVGLIKARAEVLAAQVNRLVKAGPAVLIATVPYMGASPYAVSEGGDAPRRLQVLTTAFNDALQSGGTGEGASKGLAFYGLTGKDYGLIQVGTSWIKAIAESNDAGTRERNATPVCQQSGTELLQCTTGTLNANANVNDWVWADPTRPGYQFQYQLGQRAISMAGESGLPF